MNQTSDARRIRQRFDALAAEYDRHAALYDEVGSRLLERLDGLRFAPERIVDLGCGTGRHTLALRERFPNARLLGIDGSTGMLARARQRRGRWRPRFDLVLGDLAAPPMVEAGTDLVYANLSLQWVPDLGRALAGLRRIMAPRGLLMLTLPGPDTLVELQRAGAPIDGGVELHAQELGEALTRAGFQEPVLDTDWLTTTHPDLAGLLSDLDHLGIGYTLPASQESVADCLTDQQRQGGGLNTTWEMLYATAWAPDEGQPIRTEHGEEASVSTTGLPIRKRRG